MSQKGKKHVVVDVARAIEAPESSTAPTYLELLEQGTPDEVREALRDLGFLIRHGRPLPETAAEWLGAALERIGAGEKPEEPSKALGLTRKTKFGVRYQKQMEFLVADVMRQGLTRGQAMELIAELNLEELVLQPDATGGAAEALRKRLEKSRKK